MAILCQDENRAVITEHFVLYTVMPVRVLREKENKMSQTVAIADFRAGQQKVDLMGREIKDVICQLVGMVKAQTIQDPSYNGSRKIWEFVGKEWKVEISGKDNLKRITSVSFSVHDAGHSKFLCVYSFIAADPLPARVENIEEIHSHLQDFVDAMIKHFPAIQPRLELLAKLGGVEKV